MYPANHKTVFVLDHTPYFGIPSESQIDFDFLKIRGGIGSTLPLPSISKSLWTTSIETSMEYCRIVWDLFPTEKLVRIRVSSNVFAEKFIETYSHMHFYYYRFDLWSAIILLIF